jgi:glycosyltransferase involved in cell wall biosynthesis
MTKRMTIDILIPVYNSQNTIRRCLDSILTQDYDKNAVKIILVDDGSNDDSVKIINEYKKKYPNQILLNICEHHGCAHACKTLVSLASASHFMFVDSDDYLLENALTNIANANIDGNHDITVSKALRTFEDGKSTK